MPLHEPLCFLYKNGNYFPKYIKNNNLKKKFIDKI